MGKKSELTPEVRAQIVALKDAGLSHRAISRRLSVSTGVITTSVQRYRTTGSFSSCARSGRPRATSKTDDRAICLLARKDPRITSSLIRARLPFHLANISTVTIRNRLGEVGLKACKPALKPKLSPKNIKDRLAFCRHYRNWSAEDWDKVAFSDEATFTQFKQYHAHVWRPKNCRYNPKYTVPTVKQCEKLMVWGCISSAGRAGLWVMPKGSTMTGPVYLQVLKDHLPNFMVIQGTSYFQHDGAPCHSSRLVSEWLATSGIQLLGPWPGNSPDLNPIENCWVMAKKEVAKLHPTSSADLERKIKEVWVAKISPDYCKALCRSMPERIQAVLANKGLHSKY